MDPMDQDVAKLARLMATASQDEIDHFWIALLETYGPVIARVVWKRARRRMVVAMVDFQEG